MEQQVERSKVVVRWIVIAALLAAVIYLRGRGAVPLSGATVARLTAAAAACNVLFWTILRRRCPRWLKYVTTGADVALLSVLVAVTGGSGSVFYAAYFIVVVSNSIRYGLGMALYVATAYNVGYVLVLYARPPAHDLTVEAVRILAFWGVALYAGYLAMRFQRQLRILESYEETIARLRSQLAAREGR